MKYNEIENSAELIDFMDYTFPNWEYVDAEQFLYEGIEKYKGKIQG